MVRTLRAGALAGLALFAWGAVSWTVLPFHDMTMKAFTDPMAADAFRELAPRSGVYVLSGAPFVFASVRAGGPASMSSALALSLLLNVVAGTLGVWLLRKTTTNGFRGRVLFMAVLGLAAGVFCHGPTLAWWSFPLSYVLLNVADAVIAWALAGAVVAKAL